MNDLWRVILAHSTLYHHQQSHDGTSIQIIALSCTGGGLRCNGRDYMEEMNPSKEGDETLKKE